MRFTLFKLLLLNLILSAVSVIQPADLAALEAIRDSLTDMPGSAFFSTWDFTAPDPCSSFSGLTCSLGRVATLTLGPALSGSLSPAFSNLTYLTQLILYPGLVTGPLPPHLSNLASLQVISVTRNRLTGPVPVSFSTLRNLHTLDLSYNQLSGSLPTLLTHLPNLKVLVLSANRFSGKLSPVSSPLLHLDLKMNQISGILPPTLPVTLKYLSLAGNSMQGAIHVLEPLINLTYLDLSKNQFTGTIPLSIFRPMSSSLFLQRNNFTSFTKTVTSLSSSLPQGSIVDLSYNFVAGELPPELAGAETLLLNNNRFTGKVPEEYLKNLINGTIKVLYLQQNYIMRFPWRFGHDLPDSASLCLSYNCIQIPVGLSTCPTNAAPMLSRPASQCFNFSNHSSSTG